MMVFDKAEWQRRYRKTAKGKEAQRRYRKSTANKLAQAKYRKSDNNKKAQERYRRSEKNREAQRRYDRSDKGRRRKQLDKIRNPEKMAARNWVNNAIRDGRLFRQSCEVCGQKENVHAHHDDYSKPTEVRWLCNTHHKEHHRNLMKKPKRRRK